MNLLRPQVLVVGGGPTGASLAARLAQGGMTVTLLEARRRLVDQGMGEAIYPWGGQYLDRLDLKEALLAQGLFELPEMASYYGGGAGEVEQWVNSASEFHPSYAMHYPYLQAALLRHASAAGVQVLRPARAVAGGQDDAGPFMTARHDDTDITFRPDLVVIADGRNSVAHRWLDARVVTDPPWRHIMSARVADLGIKESAMHFGYGVGEKALALPYGGGAGRIYLVCPASLASSFRGHSGFAEFLASASRLLPAGALGGVRQTGPVFGVAGHNKRVIVEKPASRIVLAGDAAGSTDPCMAMGLSLCFRDAYSLAGLILNGRPGNVAAEFRKARQSYFSVHLRHAAWSMRLWFEEGPAAESLRREVMLARSDDPYAGGWEDIYVDGADPMMEIPDGPGQFFGGTVPEWAECDDFG